MNDAPAPAPEPLDPRAVAVQELANAEQQVMAARRDRDRAMQRAEEAEAKLTEAREAAAKALGVESRDLRSLR